MKTRRPPCLDWQERLALRYEDLSPADQQALDTHVLTCDSCSEALADYHFFEARLNALPPPTIKPLPRLLPHLFDRISKEDVNQEEHRESAAPILTLASKKRSSRKPNKVATIVWRILSVAALICLLLGVSAIFRVVSLAHLASHPSDGTIFNFNQHTNFVADVGWSPDGKSIATASSDHTVKVWSASTGNLVCTYTGSDEIVYAFAWSPNSRFIASNGENNTIHIWNAMNCSSNATYAVHTEAPSYMEAPSVASLAWSPNGQYIASGNWGNNTAQIWNVTTGQTLFTSSSFMDAVSSIAWSHDGQKIAIGSWDKTVQVWDMRTKQLLHTYNNYSDTVTSVAWSPDERYLAVGNHNGTVEVRDVTNGNIVCNYPKHTDAVNAVAWSPNGKYIASGSDDKTVRIWNPFGSDTPTLMVYTQHTNHVSSVAWSPDGKEIVSGSWDDTAKVWEVSLG